MNFEINGGSAVNKGKRCKPPKRSLWPVVLLTLALLGGGMWLVLNYSAILYFTENSGMLYLIVLACQLFEVLSGKQW